MFLIRTAPTGAPLLDRLAATIGELRADDPLLPIDLVVPSPAGEARLLVAITERLGVASGLRIQLVESWLSSRLCPQRRAQRLTADDLRLELTALLDDATALEDEALGALADTLAVAPSPAARRRRRDALAATLAPLYEEYALTRPDLVAAWRRGADGVSSEPVTRLCAWQGALFRRLMARRGERGDEADRFLVELLEDARPLREGETAIFFAPGFLASRYREVLAQSAGSGRIEVLQTEYPTFLERDAARFLEEWSQPATTFLSTLTEEASARVERAELEGPDTLLGRLQFGQLPGELQPTDASLRVLDAPGAEREAQVIADAVARALAETADDAAPLRPWDIMILAAGGDADEQLGRIAAALEMRGGISAVEMDAPAGRLSSFGRAATQLLDLLESHFDRERCFALFRNPSFRAARPDADPAQWEELAVACDVRHGRDAGDHEGSYLEGDIYHWDQALVRLALGAFCPVAEEESELIEFGRRRFAPEGAEISPEERGRFAQTMRQLIAASRSFEARPQRSAAAWMQSFRELIEEQLSCAPGEPEGLAMRILTALRLAAATPTAEAVTIDFSAALERARDAIATVRIQPGASAARGVVLARLGALRPVASRMLIISGLDEGSFPASARRDGLDLRRDRPRIDEYDARQRDAQRFAEAVAGASDRLVLSYRGRDPRSGDEREASSALRGILDWGGSQIPRQQAGFDGARGSLDADGQVAEGVDGRRSPSSDHALFSGILRQEARARSWSLEGTEHLGRPLPSLDDLMRLSAPAARGDAASFFRLIDAPRGRPIIGPDHRERIQDARLIEDFLACPLQATVRAASGLRSAPEDVAQESDEPFEVGPREQTTVFRSLLTEAVLKGELDQLDDRLRERMRDIEYREPGWSTGLFREGDQVELRRRLESARRILTKEGFGELSAQRPQLLLAPSSEDGNDPTHREAPALDLDIAHPAGSGSLRLRLVARGELVRFGEDRFTWMRFLRREAQPIDLARFLVQAAWMAAAGWTDGVPGRALFIPGQGSLRALEIPALSAADARDYLRDRLAEIFGEPRYELLPIEVLHSILPGPRRIEKQKTPALPLATALQRFAHEGGVATKRGPLRRWTDFDAPSLVRARERLWARFGLFYGAELEEALQ
jgi:Exodeoxyribonuclease V, gamma subunit